MNPRTPININNLYTTKEGYVIASRKSSVDQKIRFSQGKQSYTYDLANDGREEVFPLQFKDGKCIVKIYERIKGNKFKEVYRTSFTFKLDNKFFPYLKPNKYVDFIEVNKNFDFNNIPRVDDKEVTEKYANSIVHNITYDWIKAATVKPGYVPDLLNVVSKKQGICFDIASLYAAMLRSEHIPTKLVFGNLCGKRHAWNQVFLKDHWVTVDLTSVILCKKYKQSNYKAKEFY